MAFGPEIQALPGVHSSPPITIRGIRPEEAPQLPPLRSGIGAGRYLPPGYIAAYNNIRDPKSASYREIAHGDAGIFWGIFASGPARTQLIGYTGISNLYEGEMAHTSVVIADERYQGQGIARRICPLALHFAQRDEIPGVAANIHRDNAVSLRLHQRMGFVATGEFRNLSDGEPYIETRLVVNRASLRDPQRYLSALMVLPVTARTTVDLAEALRGYQRTRAMIGQAQRHLALHPPVYA